MRSWFVLWYTSPAESFGNLSLRCCLMTADAPAICGEAMDVPDLTPYSPPLTAESTLPPTAVRSGFRFRDGVHPQDEKLLIVRLSALLPSPMVSLVVPDSYWLTMYSPAALEIEMHGMYPSPSLIFMDVVPSMLLYTITPTAPAAWAFSCFAVKVILPPRCTSAILPLTPAFVKSSFDAP